MRCTLITVAILLAVFDAIWIFERPKPEEPEYYIDLLYEDWFFEDGGLGIEDSSKLPIWDGQRWMLGGKLLPNISGEVGKRPLQSDYRCVIEYRLQDDVTFGDFLSAQRQAEDAGGSILIVTAKLDEHQFPQATDVSSLLINSIRKKVDCRIPPRT